MFRIGELLLLLLLAPPSLSDLTPLERETTGFSGAISRGLTAEWQASSTAALDSEITLTLVLRGVLNPTEVRVPSFEELGFDDKIWQALDAKPTIQTDANQVTIRYLLRVKISGELEWPEFAVIYYHPDRAEGKHFVTTYTERRVITVKAPKTDSPPHYEWPFPTASPNTGLQIPIWAWILSLPFVPVLRLVGLRFVRRLFPEVHDRERRAWVRQLRAAEKVVSSATSAQAIRDLLHGLKHHQPVGIETLLTAWESHDFGLQDQVAFQALQAQTLSTITEWRAKP
jgi:hypothetical protein